VARCHLTPEAARGLQQAADQLAAEGLRVLAVARGLEGTPAMAGHPRHGGSEASGAPPADPHDFLFEPVGFLALADPLRPDVPQAIATAQRAGVRVVMITGDGPVTRPGDRGSGRAAAGTGALRCRSAPPGRRVQRGRHGSVGIGGGGVGVCPGVAPAEAGTGTRPAGRRGTAVDRRVDANLQRALAYTLAIHLPIALLALLPLLLPGVALILLPVHIALLHLVIDPACTVVFEAMRGDPDLMDRPPRPPESPLLSAASRRRALLQGGALALASLALVFWPGCDGETRRSLVFSLLLLAGGGPALGLGLWLLLFLVPPLRQALALAPLPPGLLLVLVVVTTVTLAVASLAREAPGVASVAAAVRGTG
jgi:Ca2+-transporting ATPase